MSASVLSALAGVSTTLGVISIIAFLVFQLSAARSARSVVEQLRGEGVTTDSRGVRHILGAFKSDKARVDALALLCKVDQSTARAALSKLRSASPADLVRLEHQSRYVALIVGGGVLLLLGLTLLATR
jgi:hypothetical protein